MGASSGMGLRVAEMLAERGVPVGLAARNTKPMEELKRRFPSNVEYASIDICRSDAPERLDELIGKLGGMEVYLHISGIGYENLDLDPEREAAIVNTNAVGLSRMLCAAYRHFRANGIAGQIGVVTSVAGTNGVGKLSAYSASKKFAQTYITALEQLSIAENAGISFSDIRPGWVKTPLLVPGARYPMEMSADYAAREIIKALAHRERVCIFDDRWRLLVTLWKLIPDSVWVKMNVPVTLSDAPLPWPLSQLLVTRSDKANARKSDSPEGPLHENALLENTPRP